MRTNITIEKLEINRSKYMSKFQTGYKFHFDIRCPCCQKRLMTINLSQYKKPIVSMLTKENRGVHNTETRCPICKSFVAVDV